MTGKTAGRRPKRPSETAPGQLKVEFAALERGDRETLCYVHGGYGAYRGHGHVLMEAFEKAKVADGMTLAQYLAAEGFDLTTFRFSISHADPRALDGALAPGTKN